METSLAWQKIETSRWLRENIKTAGHTTAKKRDCETRRIWLKFCELIVKALC